MKIDWPYNPTRVEATVVAIIALLAGGLIGCTFGFAFHALPDGPVPCDAQAAAMATGRLQAPEPPLVLGQEDARLFERLRPMVERHVDARLQRVADELNATDKLGAPLGGAWSVLGAAIASLVKKLVVAVIGAMILALLVSLLWAYWYYPVGFVAVWLATTALVSKFVAAGEARKVKP